MPELNCVYSLSHVPYVQYEVLDEYAESVLLEAAPGHLKTPSPLEVDAFLEFYLRIQVEYKKLSYGGKVLGLTAFNAGHIQVFDEKTNMPMPLYVKEGTVVIDTSLLQKRNEGRLRFTLMHEAAHWMLHRRAFSEENSFFVNDKFDNQYLAAKEGRIDYSRSCREDNDGQRMERQADFFAAALLMPRPALRVAYRRYFSFYGEKPGKILRGSDIAADCHAVQLPKYVAKHFGVSKGAALIRLEKLNAITGKSDKRK